MKLLDRYIARSVLASYGVVLLLFSGIFSFFVFVEELDVVGTARYTLTHALAHILYTTPGRMIQLAPITALLGSMIGLSTLAMHRELIAMQAAGISTVRIAWSVLRIGLLFMLTIGVFEEFVNPPLLQHAYHQRAQALSTTDTLLSEHGFWFHEDTRFIKIGGLRFGKIPEDIDVYRFNARGELRSTLHAKDARIVSPTQWILRDVEERTVRPSGITARHVDHRTWESFLSTAQVDILSTPPHLFSPSQLYAYVTYLRERGKQSPRLELVFWQKVAMPLTAGIMVLLGIPFVFGPLRSSTMGKRVLVGVGMAVGFYFLNQILSHVGLLMALNPMATTFAPIVTVASIALWQWKRYV